MGIAAPGLMRLAPAWGGGRLGMLDTGRGFKRAQAGLLLTGELSGKTLHRRLLRFDAYLFRKGWNLCPG